MDLNKISTTKKLTLASIAIAINIVGGFIALGLRLPIYLDGLGTVLVAFVLGPKWGALTGFVSACVNGASFDIYSFYFSPAQILLGFLAGEIKELKIPNIKKQILLNFLLATPICIVSSIIAAKLFGTVTSSGSSYFVQILRAMGVSDVIAVFIIQLITDYLDKLFAVVFISRIVNSKGFKMIYERN